MTHESYDEWERSVPAELRSDPVWGLRVYRMALFAGELAREDGRVLASQPLTQAMAPQLVRAVGAIGANIAEGFSRVSRRDRAKFYEYALGSTREGRAWYYQVRTELGEFAAPTRLSTLSGVARMLTALINQTRAKAPPAAGG